MKYCLNTTKAVINIGGHTVIAPTKGAWVDPEVRGVQDLIDRELLVEGDAPKDDTEPAKGAASGKKAKAEAKEPTAPKEPSTVKDLKTWLDGQGAQYSPDASKAELQGLYEALKANAVEQGGAAGKEQ